MDTTLTAERIRECTVRGWWHNDTVEAQLERWARLRPDKTAMVDAQARYSYAALARLAERVAFGLKAHGVEPGQVVACQLPNWNEFAIVLLAAARLGAVVNPIPPTYRGSELRFMLGLLEARVLVVPEVFRGHRYTDMVAGFRGDVPTLEHVFVARGAPGPGMHAWSILTETAWEARESRGALPGSDPNRVHEVIFTSGTTGEPKGVMHTPNTALGTMHSIIDRLDFSDRDIILMSSTLGHQTGFLYGYCLNFLLGATVVWLDVWNAREAARLIEAERITFTMGATPFLQDLTHVDSPHDLSSLRLFISAGASIPRVLVREARSRLRCAISAGWGMTENGLATCNGLDDPEDKVFGSDGLPLPGMALRVVDEAGHDVPTGTEGELLVTGPAQFVGYFKRPQFTRDAHTADGWFKTGDRAALDADGYVSITGRSKDVIIRGGENIPVVEVENALFSHPKVAAVAVVAMPDPRLQERACAFVIPKAGESLTLADLVAHLDTKQIAKQKYPERIEIVSEFPMTPSGKIQKYRLRQIIKDKVEAEGQQAGSA